MRKGLTVIEMIVVISIIGILIGTSIPVLSHYLPGIRLNGSARVLSGNLREAQEKAITEQKQYLIRFFPDTVPPSYKMIRINESAEEEIKTVSFPNSSSLTIDPAISGDQIIFSADGGPSSSGDITISLNTAIKTLNVSPAGFIKISN